MRRRTDLAYGPCKGAKKPPEAGQSLTSDRLFQRDDRSDKELSSRRNNPWYQKETRPKVDALLDVIRSVAEDKGMEKPGFFRWHGVNQLSQ
jgi:hypothetical protein